MVALSPFQCHLYLTLPFDWYNQSVSGTLLYTSLLKMSVANTILEFNMLFPMTVVERKWFRKLAKD